ncbi:Hypothetical predicted protein [Xyrichtys novacula]|uniref:Uncharacterized protein n=1 Tax=Xyrichtys novacula TaxID=13765 RepID=A0AAV1FDT7_XYRNO|nr:Hypothetical predicted protein [Xyrichtys novacula]
MPHVFVNVQSALRCRECIHFFAWSFPSLITLFMKQFESNGSGVKCLIQEYFSPPVFFKTCEDSVQDEAQCFVCIRFWLQTASRYSVIDAFVCSSPLCIDSSSPVT